MIRVARGPQPHGFADRARDWAERFAAVRAQHPALTMSGFWSRIRRAIRPDAELLFEAFHGKCAFCESNMSHVSWAHVEHYRPMTQFPELAFTWENWLLSGQQCNHKKSTHFPDCSGHPCLIDPASEDPTAHIEFSGYIAVATTERGGETIRLVALGRSALEEERSRWQMRLNFLLLLMLVPQTASQARTLLIWAMQNEAPYAAMTRCYLRTKAPLLAGPQYPHSPLRMSDALAHIERLVNDNADSLREMAAESA